MLEIYDLEVVDIQDINNLLKRDEYDLSNDSSVLELEESED